MIRLPLEVFGHADTFGSMCQVCDIFASETCHCTTSIQQNHSGTGTFKKKLI